MSKLFRDGLHRNGLWVVIAGSLDATGMAISESHAEAENESDQTIAKILWESFSRLEEDLLIRNESDLRT